jgi:hypothetical protein
MDPLDQAVVGELEERGTQAGPGDVQLRGQFLLDEPLPRRDVAGQDRLADRGEGMCPRGLAGPRLFALSGANPGRALSALPRIDRPEMSACREANDTRAGLSTIGRVGCGQHQYKHVAIVAACSPRVSRRPC